MKIVKVNINELISPEYNPRQITDDEMEKLKNSINEFGYIDPIIVNRVNNHIVGGNQRYEALKSLGYTDVDVIFIDEPDLNREQALNIALNKISGEWDFVKLADILDDLELNDFDISLTGFDDLELENFGIEDPKEQEPVEVVEDDYEEPDELEVTVQTGDIYVLGNHRLMCGDSTKREDVALLMDGKQADMVFTDPPYLMGFTGNVHGDGSKSFNAKHGRIMNDKMSKEDGDEFVYNIINMLQENVTGAYYICFYRLGLDYIFRAMGKLNLNYKALIIWDKGNHTLSNSDYMSRYEPIIYGWFKEHNFYGDRSNFDIWDIRRTQKNELHPTMKPLELCSKAILNSSKKGDIVLDLFGGSGSTLISCEQLNRNCYMMELDPEYCQVIINRWEEFTGEKAEKIGGA